VRARVSYTIATNRERAKRVRRMVGEELQNVASKKLIHVTTTGRKTGKRHTVELWFGKIARARCKGAVE
jgi:hypothetical protein